jgi:hypothetical protein
MVFAVVLIHIRDSVYKHMRLVCILAGLSGAYVEIFAAAIEDGVIPS